MNDPELHDAIRGRRSPPAARSQGEIQKNKPSKAARNIAENRKLQGASSRASRTSRRP